MKEADILAATYEDNCTISRNGDAVKDPVTRQSRQETVIVARDIPCALSTATGGSIQFSEGHGGYHSGYTLFCRPEVDIEAGDQLRVTTRAGRIYTLWAGRPHTFAGSHTETPLLEEKRT